MKFKKNIVCVDTETTGLNHTSDRILQISVVKFNPNTGERLDRRNWYIKPTGLWSIEKSAEQTHGITKEFIEREGVSLKSMFNDFMSVKEGCAILTYNGTTFDIDFLEREFERELLDPKFYDHEFIDSFDIEKLVNSNRLADTYRRYYGHDFENAHDASADTEATIDVFMAQLDKYGDYIPIGHTDNVIAESIRKTTASTSASPEGFCDYTDSGDLRFRVGKYKFVTTNEICQRDPGYIKWLFQPNNGQNIITIPTKRAIKEEWCRYQKSLNS